MCGIKYQFYNLISSLVELKSLDVFKNTVFKPLLVFCRKKMVIFNCIHVLLLEGQGTVIVLEIPW